MERVGTVESSRVSLLASVRPSACHVFALGRGLWWHRPSPTRHVAGQTRAKQRIIYAVENCTFLTLLAFVMFVRHEDSAFLKSSARFLKSVMTYN